jgi:TonB family protein
MSRKTVLIVSSVTAHAAAVIALIVAGWWNIEKLAVETERSLIIQRPHARAQLPLPGGGDGKLPPLRPKKKGSEGATQSARKEVHDVQPVPLLEEEVPNAGDQTGADDGTDDGNEWAHEYGKEGGTGTGLFIGSDGDCRMPECGSGIPTDVEIDDPPKEEIVPPDVMTAHRKSDGKIPPPETVKVEMVRAGESQTRAALKICVSETGAVRDVSFVKRTGYDAYDAKLVREIRKWRYEPFTIDGKAAPACSVTHIIFRMK